MVISTKYVGIIDPHQRLDCIPEGRAGKKLKLKKEFLKYDGHRSCLEGVFDLTAETRKYKATLFRFPLRLRDSGSDIIDKCYTPTMVRDNLFSSLKTEAPILLLFLKNVKTLSLHEWNDASTSHKCIYRLSIERSDHKAKCTELAEAYTKSSSDATAVLTSATTRTCDEGTKNEYHEGTKNEYHWLIINSIGSDVEELRERADNMKVLPWVGIAAQVPMKFELTEQKVKLQNIETAASILSQLLTSHSCEAAGLVDGCTSGQAFCFLPLPGSIALPVNIHGYFAVADSRRSIKWPSHDEKGEEAKWNKILLEKLIAPVYALLLMCRSSLIWYHGTSIDKCIHDAYAAWPVYAEVKNQKIWSEILEPVLTRIIDLPILWTEACNGTWVKLKDAYFLNPNEKCSEVVVDMLVESGYNVVRLPPKIRETIFKNKTMETIVTERYITVGLVQMALKRMRQELLPRDHVEVYTVLEYVLSHLPYDGILTGIELLPLNDPDKLELCHFTTYKNDDTAIFVFPESYREALKFLPGISSVVVDTKIPHTLQEKMEEIASRKQLQLRLATPDIICGQLIKKSMARWCSFKGGPCIWQPGQFKQPPIEWIEHVWSWLQSHSKLLDKVSSIPIVPGEILKSAAQRVSLFSLDTKPGLCYLPEKLPNECPREAMLKILKALGLVHIEMSACVAQCHGIEQYIKCCNAQLVIQCIMKLDKSITLTSVEKDALRYFIACEIHSRTFSKEELICIKSLSIFRAGVGGSITEYVSLNSADYVLPPLGIKFDKDIQYPPYILVDEADQVNDLLMALGVERVNTVSTFCERNVLPHAMSSAHLNQSNSDRLVMWVLQCPLTEYKFLGVSNIIQPCVKSAERRKPIDLYDPSDDVFSTLFDPKRDNVFPTERYESVLPFLRLAGMKTWNSLKTEQDLMLQFLVDRAKSVSNLNERDGLTRSKKLFSLLTIQHLESTQFSSIDFLFPQTTAPSHYPSLLKWHGREMPRPTCPQNICCRSSDAYLVGSVLPILSSEYELGGRYRGFHTILTPDVISQLEHIVNSCVPPTVVADNDANPIHTVVMEIYKFLSSRIEEEITLPKKWIWWKSKKMFLGPDDFVYEVPKEIGTLEPFIYALSSNIELCTAVYSLLPKEMQEKNRLDTKEAIGVLHKMNVPNEKRLSQEEISMAVRILEWLKSKGHHTHDDLLVPTNASTLVSASQCTFDDRNWIKKESHELQKYTFVHEKVPPALAKYFSVTPLSLKIAPSEKLKLMYTKAGQHEPVTRRIRRIVEDYATTGDIFKELLQNADDAKATEVKFLIDWREHPASSLLDDELKVWQGPALVAYNNSVFSDQDFDHICELAAETKMKDPLKTGRFGVGFCATYHMTDLPSFISRNLFTMFDPHTNYLGERVSASEPGMRIDLVKNQENLRVYADQFKPYDGVFDCNVFNLRSAGFQGTLFRFPFRCQETANKSSISKEVLDEKTVNKLLKQCFNEQASHLLLFLKHVRRISVSVLEKGAKSPSEMVTVIKVEKTCKCQYGKDLKCARIGLIKNQEATENPCTCHCEITTQSFPPFVPSLTTCISKSIISSTMIEMAEPLPNTGSGKEHGLVPFAEVAIQVEETQSGILSPKPLNGGAFCFLPLPIQTGLPFHVNGFFDVSRDRSSLKATDDGRAGKRWNQYLCEGVLTQAFIHSLSILTRKSPMTHSSLSKEDKKDYLKTYYSMFRLVDGKGLVGETLPSFVKKTLPEIIKYGLIWSDVRAGEWVFPRDVILIQLENSAMTMRDTTIQVLLELQYKVCVVPYHVVQLLQNCTSGVKDKVKHIYSYHSFCTDILMLNLNKICPELRKKHFVFLLETIDRFDWIRKMIKDQPCIPVQCSSQLKLPKNLLDNGDVLLRKLYEPEDERFPEEFLQKDSIMRNLRQLGMTVELSLQDIVERADRVRKLIQDQEKAYQQSWAILEYVQEYYLPKRLYRAPKTKLNPELLCNAMKAIEFLPIAEKPVSLQIPWCTSDAKLISPQRIFTEDCKNLVFSQNVIVKLPEDFTLQPQVLSLIGALEKPPLPLVVSHLLCLSRSTQHTASEETRKYITEVTQDIYKYLRKNLLAQTTNESERDNVKEQLKGGKYIWQDDHLLNVNQVVMHWNTGCHPYLCELSSKNKEYQDLFSLLGVEDEPTIDVLASILRTIAKENPSGNQLSERVIEFIEAIVQKLDLKISESHDREVPKDVFLPDESKIMRPVKHLACDKFSKDLVQSMEIFKSQFEDGECHFVHNTITRERAITLGVRPLLETLTRSMEAETFLEGTDFGQHEDLCDRLTSILRKYPPDCSILNEFIQNADDAQASEIVFVLDHRQFPQDKLISQTENWKALQIVPALCIMNNRKFTEKDIKGISQLGRGAKGDSSDMIGRFGIGFNVAYHVTDCPSFLSFNEKGQPETLCVFDPTCSFVPRATKRDPGRRWNLTNEVVKDLPDQFKPYLLNDLTTLSQHAPNCLNNVSEQGHVVFRLPLLGDACGLQQKKKMGCSVSTAHSVCRLLEDMKTFSSDTLLFLNHVRKMSAFEISEDGKCILHFSTEHSMLPEDESKCKVFSDNMKKKLYTENISRTRISHVEPEITKKVKREWVVCKRYSTKGMKPELLKAASECKLRPLGGVAAPLQRSRQNDNFVFCFLPMPLKSNLPVHINGHFLVDDSRKHFEKTPHLGLGDWNESLASSVVAHCYVELIVHAQKMTEKGETTPEWFYSLFPHLSSEGEVGNLKLAQAVYKILLERNPNILLQIKPGPSNTTEWFRLKDREMGFFFVEYISDVTKQQVTPQPELKAALIALGMPIVSVIESHLIYQCLSEIDKDYSMKARVDPTKVISHLKRVGSSKHFHEVMKNMKTLCQLLEFFIICMTEVEVVKAIEAIPLLLCCDGRLHVWKKGTIFKSQYAHLLPKCDDSFVDKKLEECFVGRKLSDNKYNAIVPLPLSFVKQHSPLEDVAGAVEVDKMSPGSLDHVKHLWKYLSAPSMLKQTVINADIIRNYFFAKPIIPTRCRNLYPARLLNAVLCGNGDEHIQSALRKLGYPTLSFKVLNIDPPPISLGNKCSSGDDITNCFEIMTPPTYDTRLNAEEVRAFIENLRKVLLLKPNVLSMLRKLRIFKTIDGTFAAVDGKCKVFVMPREMPRSGVSDLQKETGCVILAVNDKFTEGFYRKVVPDFGAAQVTVPQLYTEFIVPNMPKVEFDHLQEHLQFIYDKKHYKSDALLSKLKETKFVKIKEELFLVSELCDPTSTFFQQFCSDTLLPEQWKACLPFFKELGLRQEVGCEEWLQHAQQFIDKDEMSPALAKELLCKTEALLKALFEIIKIHEQKTPQELDENFINFLEKVSEMLFVCNSCVPQLKHLVTTMFKAIGHQNSNENPLFCFKDSVYTNDSDLTALCRNVLPKSCNAMSKSASVRKALRIESPVKTSTIVENLQLLSEEYSCIQPRLDVDDVNALRKILYAHYHALDKAKDSTGLESLKDTLCIAVTGSLKRLVLIKPSQLIMSIPSELHLEPFCYEVPDDLKSLSHLLRVLCVPRELSGVKCAEILNEIHKQLEESESKLSEDDAFKEIALCAYAQLVCIQRKRPEQLPVELHLPGEDDNLYSNKCLFYNNANWFAKRLPKDEDNVIHFLKMPDSNEDNVPPVSLGVQLLTDIVHEELHHDMLSRNFACTDEELHANNPHKQRCQYVKDLLDTLQSPDLRKGLLRVYFAEHDQPPPERFVEAVEELQCVHIKCVNAHHVITQLVKNGQRIPKTEHRKFCHVTMKKDEVPLICIAPHRDFDKAKLLQNLSAGIKGLLQNQIKNEVHIVEMFDCHPSEIQDTLDEQQVCSYDPEVDIKETKYRAVGDVIPLKSITPKDCLIITNYEVGEKVIYQQPSGVFILGEVMHICDEAQVSDGDLHIYSSSCAVWRKTVTVKVKPQSSKEEEEEEKKEVEKEEGEREGGEEEEEKQEEEKEAEGEKKEAIEDEEEEEGEKEKEAEEEQKEEEEEGNKEQEGGTEEKAENLSDDKVVVSPLCLYKILTPPQKIFLFKNKTSALATAAPVCLPELPSTQDELYQWLEDIYTSKSFSELYGAVVSMVFLRLIKHMHYVLVVKNSKNPRLFNSAVIYLQDLQSSTETCRSDTQFIKQYDMLADKMSNLSLTRDRESEPEDDHSENVDAAVAHFDKSQWMSRRGESTYGYTPFSNSNQSSTQSTPSQPSQTVHVHQAQGPKYRPRFQPTQRRRYRPMTRGRFQPQPVQPQQPHLPPVSMKDAKMWLEEAKCDYKAAEFLMGMQLTPRIVQQPSQCGSSDDAEERKSDSETVKKKVGTKSNVAEDGESAALSEDNDETSSKRENEDKAESTSDDEVKLKESHYRDSGESEENLQYPAQICFLCHEAVEKSIKGVMYAYCGLKPDLVNCRNLVTLCDDLKSSPHCPCNLVERIQQCVMQVNEHENKSRYPNFQIPPCAPAASYTMLNAREAMSATRDLLTDLLTDTEVASLLGNLGDLPKPKFTSSLKSMAGTHEGIVI